MTFRGRRDISLSLDSRDVHTLFSLVNQLNCFLFLYQVVPELVVQEVGGHVRGKPVEQYALVGTLK